MSYQNMVDDDLKCNTVQFNYFVFRLGLSQNIYSIKFKILVLWFLQILVLSFKFIKFNLLPT